MTRRLNNPFVEYGYKGSEYFCDREQETAELVRDLHNESNVALVSPRRLGKSGLIHHVFDVMGREEPESVCIYIDILHTKNQAEFAQLFFSRVIAAMDTNAQAALRKAAQFFKGIRPTMSFDEFNGAPSLSGINRQSGSCPHCYCLRGPCKIPHGKGFHAEIPFASLELYAPGPAEPHTAGETLP